MHANYVPFCSVTGFLSLSVLLLSCHVHADLSSGAALSRTLTHTHTRTTHAQVLLVPCSAVFSKTPTHTSIHLHFPFLSFISTPSSFHCSAIPRIHCLEVKRSHAAHPSLASLQGIARRNETSFQHWRVESGTL